MWLVAVTAGPCRALPALVPATHCRTLFQNDERGLGMELNLNLLPLVLVRSHLM